MMLIELLMWRSFNLKKKGLVIRGKDYFTNKYISETLNLSLAAVKINLGVNLTKIGV